MLRESEVLLVQEGFEGWGGGHARAPGISRVVQIGREGVKGAGGMPWRGFVE